MLVVIIAIVTSSTVGLALRVLEVTIAIVPSGAGYHCYIVESASGYCCYRYEWCWLTLLYR